MTPTQRPTFSWRVIGGGGGFSYLLASGGATGINFDFTTGSLPAGITFTRASIGTYNSSGNILTTAGNDVARLNYVGGVSCLLVEGSATNLLVQSNNFSTTWTTGGGSVVTATQFISPDGANNGWKLANGAASQGFVQQTFTFSAIPYTMSAWAKLITGTSTTVLSIDGATWAPSTITAALARYSNTQTPAAGSDIAYIAIIDATLGNAEGIYGAQLETGSKMTSYIPTTTAAVTRAADSAVFTVPSGVGHLTYTFDDNSTQLVAVSAGSYTIPVTLNRPNIKSIVGSA